MIETILWDVDGTLLDFEAAEDGCIVRCLALQGASCTPTQIAEYKVINRKYWKSFEEGKITKDALYPGRFAEWFETLGRTDLDPVRMNHDYQVQLAENPVLEKDALEVLGALRETYRQYVVTNGSKVAQEGKLAKTGIGSYMDGVFISEDLGVQKPDVKFFEYCAAHIDGYDKEKTVIVGDSLTSDITGGLNAGIRCILFDPKGNADPAAAAGKYEIVKTLGEIPEMIAKM